MNNLTMNNITNNITTVVVKEKMKFDGHQYFLSKTIALACEVPVESVDTSNHISPLSFLLTTCLLVVAMTSLPILLAPAKHTLEYLQNSGVKKKRKKKAKTTWRQTRNRVNVVDAFKKTKSSSNKKVTPMMNTILKEDIPENDKKKTKDENTEDVTNGNSKVSEKNDDDDEDDTNVADVIKNNVLESAEDAIANIEEGVPEIFNNTEDENINNMEESLPNLFNVEGDENEESEEEEEEEEDAEAIRNPDYRQYQSILLSILQAIATIYFVVRYWDLLLYIPSEKKMETQILCRAVHFAIMPLYKPVSISMWPAAMPLVQYLHWSRTKGEKLSDYHNRVLPGRQPFKLDWLGLIYVTLVSFCWIIYMISLSIFAPLLVLTCWAILPSIFIITFVFLFLPVQILKGKAFCCRCCLCCWKESDLKKIPDYQIGNLIRQLAKWHNVKKDDLMNHVRKSNNESNENTELLTLKAMTVLFVIATIVSLYFFALYTSDELITFQEMLDNLNLEFDFTPSFQFAISFDFNLVFSWPTNLTLDVQIVMAYSLSMLFFDRFIDFVWIIHLYMKRFQPNEKLFDYSTKILLIPYLFGEKFLNGFEIGWECLVIGYTIVYAFGYGILALIRKCFIKIGWKNVFEDDDDEFFRKHFGRLGIGVIDSVGKTGFAKVFRILVQLLSGENFDNNEFNEMMNEMMLKIGSGLPESTITMWFENNYLSTQIDLAKHHIGDEGLIALCKAMMRKRNVMKTARLDITENNISDEGCKYLSEMLKTNTTLELLQLENNDITEKGRNALCDSLRNHQSMWLSNLDLDDEMKIIFERNFSQKKKPFENIINCTKSLNLNNCGVTDKQIIVLGNLLKTNNTLKYLHLSSNNITDVQSIGEGLKSNKTLKELYLRNNSITDDGGIQSIIDGLKTNNTLKTLYLRTNQLSDNMNSQLEAIEQYKRDGSNGYQQVKGFYII